MDDSDFISKFHGKLDKHLLDALEIMEQEPKLQRLLKLFFRTLVDQDKVLSDISYKYETKIERLEKRILDLENRFLKNSRNSSKPPSSDGFKKPLRTQSLRGKSKRKAGGQPGHAGATLDWHENPDKVIEHEKRICFNCGTPLRLGKDMGYEARQAVDVENGKRTVTEHRVLIKCCSRCNSEIKGEFPAWLTAKVQYGKEVKALALYFHIYQLIPYERTAEIFFDLWSIRISKGTLVSIVSRADEKLKDWENLAKKNLINEKVLGFDETGIRCEKKLRWLHVIRSDSTVLYFAHDNRGTPAFKDIGILPEFKGTAVHDGLKSYFEFTACKHGLSNAHHLRELNYMEEITAYAWPQRFSEFLLTPKDAVASVKSLNAKFKRKVDRQYDILLKNAYLEMGAPDEWKEEKWVRGRRKKHRKQVKRDPERLLLNRLRDHRTAVLAFSKNKNVPFTNNGSEQDIRMVKVKQKISGSFRSKAGAESFCRVRSLIATEQKNDHKIIESLKKIA